MLIFETEEPKIVIGLDSPINLQKITFILKYLVVGGATYRMSIKERNTALNETLHELKNKETWILKQRETILRKNQQIEKKLGRTKIGNNYESRLIDIDILFYNDEIIHEQELIIPHEQLHKRRFTMEPLVEISPEYAHPKLNKTLRITINFFS